MISLPLYFLIPSILGAIFAGFVCSTMGTFVVRMNLSSIGYCMSHAAFAGAAFGIYINVDPLITAVFFAFVTALLLGPLSEKARLEGNVVMGFLFSTMQNQEKLLQGKPLVYSGVVCSQSPIMMCFSFSFLLLYLSFLSPPSTRNYFPCYLIGSLQKVQG